MSDHPLVARKPWEDPSLSSNSIPSQPPNQPYMDYYNSSSYYSPAMTYPVNPYSIPSRPFLGGAIHDITAGTNSVFDSLRMFTQGISSLAQFIDSTIYAGWSSVTALTTVLNNIRSFKSNYIAQWLALVKRVLSHLSTIIRFPGHATRSKVLLIAAMATVLPMLSKLLALLLSGAAYEVEVSSPYFPIEPGHLEAAKGDRLRVLVSEKDWVYAERDDGKRGCFPRTHIAITSE